jgi:CRP/FNR family transcriptional activator FtrB
MLAQLASLGGLQRIGRGSTIFREGERADFIYALVEGRLSLLIGQDETVAHFLEAGEVVLLPPALLDLPYMATARAVTDVLALMIPAPDFRRLANSELSLASAVNRLLAAHWRLLLKHLKQSRTRDADTRVVQYLLDNVRFDAAEAKVLLPGSRRQFAAHLGMTPETLSRSFRRLTEAGVRAKGHEITIDSIARLTDLAGAARLSDPSSIASES